MNLVHNLLRRAAGLQQRSSAVGRVKVIPKIGGETG